MELSSKSASATADFEVSACKPTQFVSAKTGPGPPERVLRDFAQQAGYVGRVRLVVVDNQDSFTWNLAHLLGAQLGHFPRVLDHRATLAELQSFEPDAVVLSAGPGRPDRPSDFGLCRNVILETRLPILGVCLGHQGLGYFYGAEVVPAPRVMHGYRSRMYHDDDPLLANVPQGAHVVRYHSLCLGGLSERVQRIAWSDDGVTMAVRIPGALRWGVQFHPESILTPVGEQIVGNFLSLVGQSQARDQVSKVQPHEPYKPLSPRACVRSRKIDGMFEPAQVYRALYAEQDAFWFDGACDARSRYSYMGELGRSASFAEAADAQPPPGIVARDGSGFASPFCGGWLCALTYEADLAHDDVAHDDGSIVREVRTWIGWDHAQGDCALFALTYNDEDAFTAARWFEDTEAQLIRLAQEPLAVGAGEVRTTMSESDVQFTCGDDTYRERVRKAKGTLEAGESYELCLTAKAVFEIEDDPLDYYMRLRRHNPAPYAAFVRVGTKAIASASPELFLEVTSEGKCVARPIKGTQPRAAHPNADQALAAELRMPRFVAENLMIVDLLRHDLGRVCELGSVQVPRLMEVETHPHVHQLVSTIEGTLRTTYTARDALVAAFPGGSMTGAPKVRSMQILAELEQEPRGIYSGALGYLSADGSAKLSIVIRTAVFEGNQAVVGSGGAIVMASQPDEELEEAKAKVRPLLACRRAQA